MHCAAAGTCERKYHSTGERKYCSTGKRKFSSMLLFTDEGFRRRPKRLKQIFVTIGLVFSRTLSKFVKCRSEEMLESMAWRKVWEE